MAVLESLVCLLKGIQAGNGDYKDRGSIKNINVTSQLQLLLSLKQKVHSVHIMVSCFDGIRIEKPITQPVHLLQSFVGFFVFWFNENQDQYKCLLLQHIIWTKHHIMQKFWRSAFYPGPSQEWVVSADIEDKDLNLALIIMLISATWP